MYEEYSLTSEDFEPRNCFPLKSANDDNIPVPSVPEVSIISDQPIQIVPPSNNHNDNRIYESWQRQNFPSPKVAPTRNPPPKTAYNYENLHETKNHSSHPPENYSPYRKENPKNYSFPLTQYAEYEQTDKHRNQNQSLPVRHSNQEVYRRIERREHPQEYPHEVRNQSQNKCENVREQSGNVQAPSDLEHPDSSRSKRMVSFRSQCHSPQNVQQEFQQSTWNRSQSPVNHQYHSSEPQRQNQSSNNYDHHQYQEPQCPKNRRSFENSNESCKIVEKYPQNSFRSQNLQNESHRHSSTEEVHDHRHHHHHDQSNRHHHQDHNIRCCSGKMITSENSETIRNLLVLVHSLSEQMKCLQMQVDRLFKINEDNLRERSTCSCDKSQQSNCSSNIENAERIENERLMEDRRNRTMGQDNVVRERHDDKTNPTFLEQKVSIGVMTSFEFTVQNNQHVLEMDEEMIKDLREKSKRYALQDTETKKKPNLISRKPNGLENINEDTESHLSPSHARSSDLINSTSNERQTSENYRSINETHQQTYGNDYNESSPFRTMNSHRHGKYDNPDFHEKQTQNFNRGQNTNCISQKNQFYNSEQMDKREKNPQKRPNIESFSDDISPANHTPNVGWTFYNNVLGQVNKILRNSTLDDADDENDVVSKENKERRVQQVKAATLEYLSKMGINCNEENNPKNQNADTLYYPRMDAEFNNAQGISVMTDNNTSMKMKALALKYLNDDQLTDLRSPKKRNEAALKQVMISNVEDTNFSLATMKYLQKYQLLPGGYKGPEDYMEAETENATVLNAMEKQRIETGNMERRPILRNSVQSQAVPTSNRLLDSSNPKNRQHLR